MKKLNWMFGALVYSFLVAMTPALIWALSELFFILGKRLHEAVAWFMSNSHSGWMVYGTFFVIGLIIQFYRPLFKKP